MISFKRYPPLLEDRMGKKAQQAMDALERESHKAYVRMGKVQVEKDDESDS